jgi:hypothetical protein
MTEIVFQHELEKLKKFDKNSKWFHSHYQELKERYKGRYVAINNEIDDTGPIDHDKDFQTLIKRLHERYGDISSFAIEPVNEQRVEYII